MRFIRVKGRVVPIREKGELTHAERSRSAAEGTALVGAGLGVGIGSGKIAQTMLRNSATLENTSRTLTKQFHALKNSGEMFQRAAKQTGRLALRTRISSFELFNRRLKVLGGGRALASVLIGVGVNRLAKAASGRRDSEVKDDLAAGAIGALAGAAVMGGYYRKLGGAGFKNWATAVVRNLSGQTAKLARIKKGFF